MNDEDADIEILEVYVLGSFSKASVALRYVRSIFSTLIRLCLPFPGPFSLPA